MNIACITYRKWALDIYNNLYSVYKNDHNFLIWSDKNDFDSSNLKKFKPDLILWYGWSWKVEEEFVINYKSIMLHPSPLPKYRGGSPIQNQIINNEKTGAVTLFRMNEGIDTGDIYQQFKMDLTGSLNEIFTRISIIGFSATCNIIEGNYNILKQNDSESTFYKRRLPEESEITVSELKNKPAEYLYNKVRMLADPYPNAFIKTSDNKKLIIKVVEVKDF